MDNARGGNEKCRQLGKISRKKLIHIIILFVASASVFVCFRCSVNCHKDNHITKNKATACARVCAFAL